MTDFLFTVWTGRILFYNQISPFIVNTRPLKKINAQIYIVCFAIARNIYVYMQNLAKMLVTKKKKAKEKTIILF